jgi:HlyD family secretion protein
MRRLALALSVSAVLLACSGDKPSTYQGYVEGEYVHVASPVGGRLDRLLVQRGQTIEAKAPLFQLEDDQESAAREQAEEQLKAAQAQLADLRQGKRNPELDVAEAQLAQARAAESQAAQQLKRDEAQFEVGGIPRAQLEDSRANHAIKAARVRELSGQIEVLRLPAHRSRRRARRPSSRPGGSTRSTSPRPRAAWSSIRSTARASGCRRAAPWCACCRPRT